MVDAKVDAAVIATIESGPCLHCGLDAPLLDVFRELSGARSAVDTFGRFFVPLGGVGEHPRTIIEGASVVNFSQRQRASRKITEQWNVNFAAVDVALDQRRLMEVAQNSSNRTSQRGLITDDRVKVDSYAGIFTRRLDDQRVGERQRHHFGKRVNDGELRRGDSARREKLLRFVFVE